MTHGRRARFGGDLRPVAAVGGDGALRPHVSRHHERQAQPRDRRAAGRGAPDPRRRAEPGRGDARRRLEHARPPARDDADRQHHAPLRAVPVRRDLVGEEGRRAALGHPPHDVDRHRGVLGVPRQRDDGAAHRAGHAAHHRRAQGQALSLPVRADLRVEHRRHGHADRRSAEHHDRLGDRPHVQRFRHRADADHHPDLRRDDDPALLLLGTAPARRPTRTGGT